MVTRSRRAAYEPTGTSARELLADAMRYGAAGVPAPVLLLDLLVALPADEVDGITGDLLVASVRRLWDRGWQPADLARRVSRRAGTDAGALVVAAIGEDAIRYLPDGCDERWALQLDDIGARPPGPRGLWAAWAATVAIDRWTALGLAAEVLGLLSRLEPLARLCDPPGTPGSHHRVVGAAAADPAMLNRVRALLAKAESTTFPEEAEALASKAQELISRHAIDRALLAADLGRAANAAGGRRLAIDDPYIGPKALLLNGIAEANRCKSVYSTEGGYADVFGHDDDLDAVELLFVSLLTFATASLARLGRSGNPAERTRSFRQSFLVAFGSRVGERLAEAAHGAEADATVAHGERLLPVLRAREAAVEERLRSAHPRTRAKGFNVHDGAGWAAGRAAAELADLGRAEALPDRR